MSGQQCPPVPTLTWGAPTVVGAHEVRSARLGLWVLYAESDGYWVLASRDTRRAHAYASPRTIDAAMMAAEQFLIDHEISFRK